MSKKRQLNLENLARLRKAVANGGPEKFIMSDITYQQSCGTAYCFAGRVDTLMTSIEMNQSEWLGVSEETASNLFKYVPEEYLSWTKEERFEWALRRLNELKEKGCLTQLPLHYFSLMRGI